jgi:hypothetical protein
MKKYRAYIGLFLIALIGLIIGLGVPGCATPQQNAQLRTLSQLGLAVAASNGVISAGDAIVIGDGIGTLTSGADKRTKLVHLASIGLAEAVRQDLLKQGDTVLIQSAVEALVIHPPVAVEPALPVPALPTGDGLK